MKKDKSCEEKGKNPVLAVVLSVGAAYLITAVIFIIYAVLLTYTGLSEKYMQTVVTAAVGVSSAAGGFVCGRSVKKRGIVWGVLTGVMYGVIMIIGGSCVNPDFVPGGKTLLIVLVSLCGGGLGGVLGINL
ncbi:MAG: TIGR04086 family membrane protein [Clostridiales bacterium]|nr:TIGR04086 family membrane protein [Clostridiales bacterium]